MSHKLIVPSPRSSFVFTNSNYDYTNTNTNSSSHLCIIRDRDPANMAKNHDSEKSVGTDGKTIF